MEASSLKRYLERLCDDMGWVYAIFWKLDHRPPQSLTWEEGYFALPQTRNEAPVSETKYLISFGKDFVAEGNDADYSDAFTLAQVSSTKHKVGEGLLGQVVYTNCPRVISLDNDAASCSMEVPFAPDVSLPFHSTKTILLVPVHPHGVLQLGSFEEVAEDAAIAAHVRENFLAQCANDSQRDDPDAQTVPFHVEVTYDTLPEGIREVNPGNKVTMSQLDISEEASLFEIFPFPNDLMDADTGNSLEDVNFWISCPEEQFPSLFRGCGSANSNDSSSAGQHPCDNEIIKKDSGHDVCSPISNGAIGSTFSFPPGCELHKALGPAFMEQEQKEKTASESFVSSGNLSSISYLHDETNLLGDSNSLTPCIMREKEESFSETGVTSLSEMPDASSVSDLYDVKPSIPLLTQIPNAFGQSSGHSLVIKKPLDNEPLPHVPMRRLNKQSTGSRKRARAWENQRPRPRDRQLIQERLKELRELVPKGAKCSIDSLLDQTIKHMNFLGRVIKQAEKLAKIAMIKALLFEGKIETFPIAVEDLSQPGHMLIKMKCNEHGLFLEMAEVISRLPLTILKGLLEIHANDTWACFVVEVTKGFHKMDIFWSLMQLLQLVKGHQCCKV
ncbi:hypothetical protein MLD38_026521 [Melastoma candidum]|uniref:Uncharacterized protein n=1 Tax=Melastoma candidum TaxID=119954 RepID=A0ACB9P0Q8_9MYRT|nr:hypothetical protein MLD38_026521 [Melastoma candidum]